MNDKKVIMNALREAALDYLGEEAVRERYSGRGMYSSTCFGITGTFDELWEVCMMAQLELGDDDGDALPAPTQDSMGRDLIWYWPSLRTTDEG